MTDANRYFISTAIPYVNAKPHLGFALEAVLTDAVARYHRLRGEDVFALTGSDENSLKNVQAAGKEGIGVQQLVDRNAVYYQELRGVLDLSFDDFIRTSVDPRHARGVYRLWEACAARGDIYRGSYRGLYCVGCEQFYNEDELVGGLCPEHLVAPEPVEEENYFFRLSRYQQPLEELIASDRLRIYPAARKNELLSFIRRGLADISISRSQARARGWGIPVSGDPGQVVYVWYDALANYITALGYGEDSPLYRRYWAENERRAHVIGKGIIRFHAVYWPAMLLSAGEPVPSEILVHGYLTVAGQKISKSLGNAVDPVEVASWYGIDPLRYFLLRHIPATGDGDFTAERLGAVYIADLADQLGNLLSRTVNMAARYCEGLVPTPVEGTGTGRRLAELGRGLCGRVDEAMGRYAPDEALAAIWELISAANKYVVEEQPWLLAKQRERADLPAQERADAAARLATVLYNLLEALRLAGYLLAPFLPTTSGAVARQLGGRLDEGLPWPAAAGWGLLPPGTRIAPGPALFPKGESRAVPQGNRK